MAHDTTFEEVRNQESGVRRDEEWVVRDEG
jgi:hypothetical protein